MRRESAKLLTLDADSADSRQAAGIDSEPAGQAQQTAQQSAEIGDELQMTDPPAPGEKRRERREKAERGQPIATADKSGDGRYRTRTCDPLGVNEVLWPTELIAR